MEFNLGIANLIGALIIAQLDFLAEAQNVVFLGPPATGKTHLSISLGVQAARAGHRVAFATADQWVNRLGAAKRAARLDEESRASLPDPAAHRGRGGLCATRRHSSPGGQSGPPSATRDDAERPTAPALEMPEPSMVIEDFAYYLERWPSTMVYLGAQVDGATSFNQSADVRFDESVMTVGLALHSPVVDPST